LNGKRFREDSRIAIAKRNFAKAGNAFVPDAKIRIKRDAGGLS
jgi:hypothetical protein